MFSKSVLAGVFMVAHALALPTQRSAELLTNGDFSSGLDGWTTASTATNGVVKAVSKDSTSVSPAAQFSISNAKPNTRTSLSQSFPLLPTENAHYKLNFRARVASDPVSFWDAGCRFALSKPYSSGFRNNTGIFPGNIVQSSSNIVSDNDNDDGEALIRLDVAGNWEEYEVLFFADSAEQREVAFLFECAQISKNAPANADVLLDEVRLV